MQFFCIIFFADNCAFFSYKKNCLLFKSCLFMFLLVVNDHLPCNLHLTNWLRKFFGSCFRCVVKIVSELATFCLLVFVVGNMDKVV